ncbi:hypothetical protein SAMN05421663_10526 [Terribacillus halophilus]|uniref:HEAT repeat-containing protein n=1 Tax=Terribacillus halophilus TaxID=361279 RepID=A0A1G6QC40_9BACI|nr:hypothetical protein [Terribacillus halophilus]SDC90062.1 hypothetical protein SAMN05421663_10526 [Terribacillus halophilus]
MDDQIKEAFLRSKSKDKQESYEAYLYILQVTEKQIDWAYEVWDDLLESLSDKDNHQRSRAAQYLANLAKSDPEKRMHADLPKLLEVTKDKQFVTARHSLQAIWKIGLADGVLKEKMMTYMADRFINGINEKNYTLIRFDIIQNMKHLYDQLGDEAIKQTAMELIDTVVDDKYKKKYKSVWR